MAWDSLSIGVFACHIVFDISKDEETGMWMLNHGFDHGSWVTSPTSGYYEDRWRIYWWNGELNCLFLRSRTGWLTVLCRNCGSEFDEVGCADHD